ncbi:MAG: HAD-IA family hydrolase [Candidatus Uhrbacteria bacterium]|nr:HAD-IA family hydrolase [Patescibacteria group bacterium]MBU1906623.1 HAD-IA family hydrolase [Patescibacteria group bacterium]
MPYQAILFDADGMVVKKKMFSAEVEKDYGITWAKMEPFFKGVFEDCKLGKADLKEELGKVIADWGWQGTVQELMDYWFKVGSEVDSQVAELIRELRVQGTKCYLTSNNEKYRAQYFRDRMGFNELFDGLFFSSEIGYMKHEPEFFEYVLNTIGPIEKDQVLFVDDDEENIGVAKEFGLSTHFYQDFKTFEKIARQ